MLFVTKKPHRYNGGKRVEGTRRRQKYEFGDEFEVHRHDMRLVQALGWGVPAEAKPTPAAKKAAPPKKPATPAEQEQPAVTIAPTPPPTAAPAPAAEAPTATPEPTAAPTAAPRVIPRRTSSDGAATESA